MNVIKLKICGNDAILFNKTVEVSVKDENAGQEVIMKLSDAILDGKIKSLRLNLPDKIVYVSAKDENHIVMRAVIPTLN